MGTVSCKASPVFTFCCIKNNVPKRKDGEKKNKQNKQHSPNKKQQKKKQGRPDLIYDTSDDRWMQGRCIGRGGNLHLQ